ncbi:hypothetical protein R69608_06673 [Paraburkholderia nemoris]|uniref:Uncharacterized protein n=1 Tax=Paraburkholderia nemoris TaxID=2793076 RepID=A0ABM8T0H6_9BURK|nr:hypothetical protein ADM96_26925 [Burkholderia sp. ST111]CAE6834230.1 hypothetical protein R69619_06711 [Paraburkholderia nemoris]CAE6843961.1 hypothetical protein R75777_07213 [Paraburkholderia nemoris]CAE6846170.1 hypothetical protein R69776_07278 [Paraburkholderia nemoris]CAE6963639.1 hypothetical protein R69608_06673 [Paraburkholderia nemoris]
MSNLTEMGHIRAVAALAANAEDASIWRWFAPLLEDRRIRWCRSGNGWLVSVDNRHVATDSSFDSAIRAAREATQRSGQLLTHGAAGELRAT